MILPEAWISFAFATLAFACMPGPAILYMTSQTLAHGRRAGFMAALGIHLGCYVHIAAATAGLATLLHHAPMVYLGIKLAGAVYLIWLGGSMILGRHAASADSALPKPGVLRDSAVVEVLNPKTALFFLTFLPQFVNPESAAPLWLQFLVLGSIVNLIFSVADLVAVIFASLLIGPLSANGLMRFMPKVSGSILVGLGLVLARQYT